MVRERERREGGEVEGGDVVSTDVREACTSAGHGGAGGAGRREVGY